MRDESECRSRTESVYANVTLAEALTLQLHHRKFNDSADGRATYVDCHVILENAN